MRVVLEVNVLKLIEDLAKNKDDVFAQIMNEVREESRRSEESPVLILRRKFEERQIRMSRYYGNLRDDNDKVASTLDDEATKAIDRAIEIVGNRVNQYGVSEPSIQKLGSSRINVDLPGVSKEAEVRQLLQGQPCSIQASGSGGMASPKRSMPRRRGRRHDRYHCCGSTGPGRRHDEDLHPRWRIDTGPVRGETPTLVPSTSRLPASRWRRKTATGSRWLDRDDIKRVIPNDVQFIWSAKPQIVEGGKKYYALYPVKRSPELTGGVVTTAQATLDPSYNQPIVTMEMNSDGARNGPGSRRQRRQAHRHRSG
jgi:preprotein translocase subunit SecD